MREVHVVLTAGKLLNLEAESFQEAFRNASAHADADAQ